MLTRIIAARRANNVMNKDLLGSLMQSSDENSQALTDDQIADNIIGVLFAAQDTTASVLTWIVKYLRDHPSFLDAVTVIIIIHSLVCFVFFITISFAVSLLRKQTMCI